MSNNIYNLVKYLKDSLKFKGENELIECLYKNFSFLNCSDLIQDGFIILYDIPLEIMIDIEYEYIKINNYIISRKNKPKEIEWLNEDGSYSFVLNNEPIYRRLVPLPWETIDHAFIIKNIISETSHLYDKKHINYIEYGTRNGDCLNQISQLVTNVYGVDIIDYNPTSSNILFFKMLTDEFSEKYLHDIKFCYAFIDADHSSKQVIKDFDNIFKHIELGGYIFLHDTYPCIIENLKPTACNDCYRTPFLIKEKYDKKSFEILTIPINPGLTIIRKIK